MKIPRPLLLAGTVIFIFILFGACVTLTFALVRSRTPSANSVSGQVALQQGASPPADALVRVQILDISAPDAPAGEPAILGEQIIPSPVEFPAPFEVVYDPKAIDEQHTYMVQAQVADQAGNLLFANKTVYPVITKEYPSTGVEIVVDPFLEAAGAASDSPAAASVSGSVTYREQFTMPADAVVFVQLVDATAADAPVQVIDDQTIANPGQIPVPFNLIYDPQAIDEARTYVVKARIADGAGKLLFETRAEYPVLTQGRPNMGVEVVVEPVQEKLQASASLTGTLTYREKIALPANAVAYVQLIDLSVGDTPAGWVGKLTITHPGQAPIPFGIQYDPNQINPAHLYSIKASIEDGAGNLLFATSHNYPVLTLGNPVDGVEIVLDRVYKGMQLRPTAGMLGVGFD
ncbi:MAG: YbaY family lipoprotein [Anaerolineales bacterium]|nr:YbaY family lipoprotein [Anaerolineales bacterium]